jgi:hypothetical protein
MYSEGGRSMSMTLSKGCSITGIVDRTTKVLGMGNGEWGMGNGEWEMGRTFNLGPGRIGNVLFFHKERILT